MNKFKEYYSKLTNQELIKIVFFEKRKFKKDAIISAKEILKQRDLTKNQILLFKNEIRDKNRKEIKQKLKDKNVKYGILDFLFDLIFYG